MPLDFDDKPQPTAYAKLGGGRHQYRPGITRKAYPPGVKAAVASYETRCRSGTRPPLATPSRTQQQLKDTPAEYLVREGRKVVEPRQLNGVFAAKLEALPWKDGITTVPMVFNRVQISRRVKAVRPGTSLVEKSHWRDRVAKPDTIVPAKFAWVPFTTTFYGKEAVAAHRRQAKLDHNYYVRRVSKGDSEGTEGSGGSGAYRTAQSARVIIYQSGTPMSSVGGELPLDPMPRDERRCAHPPCKEILDPGRHDDVQYCDRNCAQKHRRWLAKREIKNANLKPKNPWREMQHPWHGDQVIDLSKYFELMNRDVISENTSRRGFVLEDGLTRGLRDWPIAGLYATGEISELQYKAFLDFAHGLDVGRLRAEPRDKHDLTPWVPRPPYFDSREPITTRISDIVTAVHDNKQSQARTVAADRAVGKRNRAIILAALAGFAVDLRKLRAALDRLIAQYAKDELTNHKEYPNG
jgi:hypothetical protein